MRLTAIIQADALSTGERMYVAHCPELDVVSQGETKELAVFNLREAIEGLIEVGGQAEIDRRLQADTTVESLEIAA